MEEKANSLHGKIGTQRKAMGGINAAREANIQELLLTLICSDTTITVTSAIIATVAIITIANVSTAIIANTTMTIATVIMIGSDKKTVCQLIMNPADLPTVQALHWEPLAAKESLLPPPLSPTSFGFYTLNPKSPYNIFAQLQRPFICQHCA